MRHPNPAQLKFVTSALPILAATVAVVVMLVAGVQTAFAEAPTTPCPTINGVLQVRDINGICPTAESFACLSPNNCTAEDVPGFTAQTTAVQPCAAEGAEGRYKFQMNVTTRADRYNLGFFIALDGGPAERPPNGNVCVRDYLSPVNPAPRDVNPYSVQGFTTYPIIAIDLNSGYGAFANLQAPGTSHGNPKDGCGDINSKANGGSIKYGFHDAVLPITCIPTDPDGYIREIDTCLSWIQPGGLDTTATCEKPADIQPGPGTTAKCKCKPTTLTPPICVPPKLRLINTGAPTYVAPGQKITYSIVAYNEGTVQDAANVVITDVVPSYLTLDPANPPKWIAPATGTCAVTSQPDGSKLVRCALDGTLQHLNGSTFSSAGIQIVATVGSGAPSPMSNTATVSGGPVACPYTAEDTATNTTPVTLSYFKTSRDGDAVTFEWSTATETANEGFNLYVEEQGVRRQLNDELIPSASADSLARQDYTFKAQGVKGSTFLFEDVDFYNRTRMHGPFNLGETYGERVTEEKTNWPVIGAEHAAKEMARQTVRRAEAVRQVGQLRNQWSRVQALGGQPRVPTGPVTKGLNYPSFELRVDRTGLYRVTYEQLKAAGLDLSGVAAGDLALSNRNKVVPVRVAGADPFGPGGFVEFYAEAVDSLYTHTNVYLLQVNPDLAARVTVDVTAPSAAEQPVASYPKTVSVNKQVTYSQSAPNGDPWLDARIRATSAPSSLSRDLELPGYVASAGGGSLSVDVWGASSFQDVDPDHHVIFQVNGVDVAEARFDGVSDSPVVVDLPAGVLREGTNTLTIVLPNDTGAERDTIYLDRYSITYPRAFGSEDGQLIFKQTGSLFKVDSLPSADVMVYRVDDTVTLLKGAAVTASADGSYSVAFRGSATPATYVVSADEALHTPVIQPARPMADITSGAVDYLMIAHPDFLAGLEPLVKARTAQGMTVRVVNVEDVYAQFSYGVVDPQGIRDYIRFAATDLGTQYVLLVGGDTYDYFNYLGLGAVSFIPTPYAAAGYGIHWAPVDPLYADVDNDGVPDVALGRFPVRTNEELASVVAKTLAYDGKSYGGKAIFAADKAAAGTNFSAISDNMLLGLGPKWTVQKSYLDNLTIDDARSTLLGALNGGVALANFVGHSGAASWTFSGLFKNADAEALANTGLPTVVSQWGCWNTYYVSPAYDSLGHKLMLSGDRGAAAVLGAATLSESASEKLLGVALTPKLVTPGTTIGMAMRDAKQEVARKDRTVTDVLLGWTLLGDPALVVEP